MNALSIVNKVVTLVSYNMHKTRLNAITACVKSLLNGSAATVTSIGRGIKTKPLKNIGLNVPTACFQTRIYSVKHHLSMHLFANYFVAAHHALLSQSTGQI